MTDAPQDRSLAMHDAASPQASPWPAPLGPAARITLAGDFLNLVGPQTEADEAALLLQFLAFFGNYVGRSPFYEVEAAQHHGNLFVLVVGNTAKGRKGTSEAHVRRIFARADDAWVENRIFSGSSSGEGIITKVRDTRQVMNRRGESETLSAAEDKRLLVVEAEFGKVLLVMSRDGNTLSALLRETWDGRKLQIMTRNDPESATDAHISMIGHITATELRQKMNDCESFNGFGNRILWACSRRSRELPFGGEVAEHNLEELRHQLHSLIGQARRVTRVPLLDAARARWPVEYHRLSADRPGLFGALTCRAEAQVMRLALLYTLLDGKEAIDVKHLESGLEVWRYCEDSVRYLFGDALGDITADRIRDELLARPNGMARSAIREEIFRRNTSSKDIGHALRLLLEHRMARMEVRATAGRPEERWHAVTPARTWTPAPHAETR